MTLSASLTRRQPARLTWLLLLALVSVNTALAWHQAAHAFEQVAIQNSSHPAQTAAQLDNHCDLCLSAHGFNAGPLAIVPLLPQLSAAPDWRLPATHSLHTKAPQRARARSPPVSLPL